MIETFLREETQTFSPPRHHPVPAVLGAVMVVTRARLSDPGDQQQRSFQDQQNSRPGIIGSPGQPSPAQPSTQHCLHLGIETQLGVGTRVLQFGHGFMDAQVQLYLQYNIWRDRSLAN